MKQERHAATPWVTPAEGARFSRMAYRQFLEKLHSGEIRSIRVGRKYLTRIDWVDEWLLSLESTGLLEEGK